MDVLREIPGREALKLRAEVSSLGELIFVFNFTCFINFYYLVLIYICIESPHPYLSMSLRLLLWHRICVNKGLQLTKGLSRFLNSVFLYEEIANLERNASSPFARMSIEYWGGLISYGWTVHLPLPPKVWWGSGVRAFYIWLVPQKSVQFMEILLVRKSVAISFLHHLVDALSRSGIRYIHLFILHSLIS